MRLNIVLLLSEFMMTDVAPRGESAANLSAFDLGVYANQFLWNLDQAFVVGNNDHRLAALGLINGMRSCGAGLVEMKPDMPLSVFLIQIERYLPAKPGPDFMESIIDSLYRGQDERDFRPEGEWVYSQYEVGQEREDLRRVIVDETLQTLQQREWFRLGWLIDSGRHRPDTGNYLFKPDLRPLGQLPAPVHPQIIQTSDEVPELLPQNVSPSADEQRRPYRTFTPGELPPPPGWWLELFHLCQRLHVPCDRKPPDLSTVSYIVEIVEQMIERARTTIAPNATATLAASSDGHQQSASGSPTIGTARNDQEWPPPTEAGNDPLNGDSTEQLGEDVSVRQPVTATENLVTPAGTIIPLTPTAPIVGVTLNENGPTQTDEGSSSSKDGDLITPMPVPPAIGLETFGKWEFWPTEVQFKDNGRLPLTGVERAILERLLRTKNPEGWVNWTVLASEAWDSDADPDRKVVIAGVYRLNKYSREYAKKCGSSKLVSSYGGKGDLSYRIEPLLK